jgi:hypothetical protein
MKNNREFDSVRFMRQVRDKMSADMRDMSFEEQRLYIEQHASKVRRELPQARRPHLGASQRVSQGG